MADPRLKTSDSSGWPALEEEQRHWVSRFNSDALTLAQRERIRLSYSAAIVPQIAKLAVDISGELAISPATAFRALGTLVDRGVLSAANSQRRNRMWLAEPGLRSMDDCAARAGRRRLPQ